MERHLFRCSAFAFFALLLTSQAQAYTVVGTTTDPSITYPLSKTDTVIQDGTHPLNRFTLHRVVRVNPEAEHKGSIILLPSLVCNFKEYMLNENQDAMESLAAALAFANFDVYGYSPRTANVPQNGCSSGTVDCSVMANWGLDTYLADIAYIRDQVELNHPGEKPAIGGLSLGAMLGIASVNDDPDGYGGLLMYEGILYSDDPEIVALNTAHCAEHTATVASGTYFNEGLPNAAKTAESQGEIAVVHLFGDPNPNFGTPTFITAVADTLRTHFLYSSYPRAAQVIRDFNYVESVPLMRDVFCSFAGDRTFTGNLQNYVDPVFAIKGGQAFGPYMDDTLGLMGSTNVLIRNDVEFGHVDAYTSPNHDTYIETPLINWLNMDVF